ncbi:hypothetical protein KQR57_02045 [Bacillus inaquosorum]|nr:hypothetical protein [Bacillus inaquosorum]
MVLLASYSAFLSKLSGQDDIIVGSPVAGRSQADVSRVIGMFVNTLARARIRKVKRRLLTILAK